ncbi:tyrosine-type recombinase/integrase [Teichococcus deserti]|uniref:tyrosine-type recombinase/integrase n=1 Tax=Teichococcus deserti TaxID=1817963 RepID=UPI0009F83A47|nr:tyrosine-type recombinase/integrase [Pseudoroseomonas deserti]
MGHRHAADDKSLARVLQQAPPEAAALLAGPLGAAIAQAAAYAGKSLSENTRRAYASDWRAFAAWCDGLDQPALPADPVLIAAHLASLAGSLGRSGLKRRLAAIAHAHRQANLPWQPGHPAIRATLRGILASHGKPTRPAAALTSVEVKQLLRACGTDLAGLRDRALFLLGFAAALRRSELVAIDREHLRFTSEGMTLEIPRSKRDQEGEGARLGIPRGNNPLSCPVRAVEEWLKRARIDYGAVFRRVTAAGTLEGRLGDQGVWRILRRRAERAGITVDAAERLSPHGLRAGFITEAYLNGARDEQVMQHARQSDFSTTQSYRRRAKITAESPARLLDL